MLRIQGAQRAVGLAGHGVFLRASAVSCGTHTVLLVLLVGMPWWHASLSTTPGPRRTTEARRAVTVSAPEELTWVDLAPPNAVALPAIPASDLPQASEDHAARDRGQQLGRSVAPSIAIAADTRAPAADHGDSTGRMLDPAFRRDSSSLHARLTDGSTRYRPEHERTARVASSPDATRKERRVGMGDSSRTRHHAVAEARPASPAAIIADGEDDGRLPAGDEVQAPQRTDGKDPVRGDGALDAQAGARQFDVTVPGPARDTRWVRAASDEKHPGLMDLSAVSSPGPVDGHAGRGPGEQPGVLAHTASGAAPSVPGDDAMNPGADWSRSAAEQTRNRYEMEIRRRVARALRFPRRLALLLEQGESIVAFTIGPDGKLEGEIRLLKSAGFEEFDAEAKAAVARAAPFPPTGRAHSVSMRVPFENPVVR